MRVKFQSEYKIYLIRFLTEKWTDVAYIVLGLNGLQAEVEFPSDWHEHRQGWVRLSFGLFKICFAFPWKWTVPDHYQCSGPTYGFQFYEDLFWILYGKSKGTRDDPLRTIYMPWAWNHMKHEILSEPESHPYVYQLKSGELQHRTATIKVERRTWTRYWIPVKRVSRYIDIEFSDEVGERSGSWKGGCIGCSYDMLPEETPVQTLRRMELDRKF